MPAVSVIVPVYKVEKYIHRCVDSILAQTFTDFELILVDDGSPDRCPEICDLYALNDARVRVLHLQNGGVSKARNVGLDMATGRYIAFCDSDDWWDNTLLTCAVNELEAGSDWVSFRYRRVGPDGATDAIAYPAGRWEFPNWDNKCAYLFSYFLRCRSGWEVWARLFKREIIEKNRIRFCETCGNFAEDLGFCVKYLLCADAVSATEQCLYNYYQHDQSMMAASKNAIKLNEMNEVSADVRAFAETVMPKEVYNRTAGLLHHQIMYNQYNKLLFNERYRTFPEEIRKIERMECFREGTIATIRNRNYIQKMYGRWNMVQIVNFSVFCLHLQWYPYMLTKRITKFVYEVVKKCAAN